MSNKKQNTFPELRFPEFENNGDWKKKKLTDIANVVASGDLDYNRFSTVKTESHIYPIYSNSVSNEGLYGFSSYSKYKGKSVTITARGTLGVAFYRASDYVGIGRLLIISDFKDTDAIFFKENWNYYARIDLENGGIPQLTAVKAKLTTLLYPNIKEQKKIANCLSSIDNLITGETDKLDQLKNHKKGLLQHLFPVHGESEPLFRFPEFENDGDWLENKLSNLIINIAPPKKLQSSHYNDSGKYPIIDQSQNKIAGWCDDEDALVKNDFPVIVFGDHTCILKIIESEFIQGADGIKILKGNAFIDTRYLFYALQNNPLIMQEYKRHYSILKDKMIYYPNIKTGEQKKIADCLWSIDAMLEAQITKIENLKMHKKGLMQQLFPNVNDLKE